MLIGLHGLAGSGKSTTASFIIEESSFDFQEVYFAEDLKKIVGLLFNLSDQQLNTQEGKKTIVPELGVTPRQLLQCIGTELFRETLPKALPDLKYKSIWIDLTVAKIKRLLENKNVVVSDCRFPDEIETIRSLGGLVIGIKRGCIENNNSHGSEVFYGDICDKVIDNSSITLEDLKSIIKKTIEEYSKSK